MNLDDMINSLTPEEKDFLNKLEKILPIFNEKRKIEVSQLKEQIRVKQLADKQADYVDVVEVGKDGDTKVRVYKDGRREGIK